MADPFEDYAKGLTSPHDDGYDWTADDGVDLPTVSRSISVTESGVVRFVTLGGTTVNRYIAAGAPLPYRATRIMATGTTATGIGVNI